MDEHFVKIYEAIFCKELTHKIILDNECRVSG